jgi:hypothetical protein
MVSSAGTVSAGGRFTSFTTTLKPLVALSYSVVVSNIAAAVASKDAVLVVTLPVPPRFDSISLTPEGQIRLQVSGPSGQRLLGLHYCVALKSSQLSLTRAAQRRGGVQQEIPISSGRMSARRRAPSPHLGR